MMYDESRKGRSGRCEARGEGVMKFGLFNVLRWVSREERVSTLNIQNRNGIQVDLKIMRTKIVFPGQITVK